MINSTMLSNAFRLIVQSGVPCNADTVGGNEGAVDLGSCLRLGNNEMVSNVYTTPAFLVNLIVQNLFVIAGILIFLYIFYAGFKMISGGKKGFEEAKTMLTNALIGLIIMICAYWIVQVVGYITGVQVSLPTN